MLLFSTSLLIFSLVQAQKYDYSKGPNGPAHWAELFEKCALKEQSPVDIPPSFTFDHSSPLNLPIFDFLYESDQEEEFGTIDIINSGKDVDIEYTLDQADKLRLSGVEVLPFVVGRAGSAQDFLFEVVQIHFHWGSRRELGSEHTIAGKHYPLEMHIIHFNAGKYASFAEAFKNADGILVVGVLFDNNGDGTSASEIALSNLESIYTSDNFTVGTASKSSAFKVSEVVSELDTSKFYAYKGSLTNPTCDQVITWIVMKDILKVKESTLKAFRSILDSSGNPIQDNFRPTQDGNGRLVFDAELNSFAEIGEGHSHKKDFAGVTVVLVLAGLVLLFACAVSVAKRYRGTPNYIPETYSSEMQVKRKEKETPVSRPSEMPIHLQTL